MKITALGATGGEVTGSAYLVRTARSRVLIDCGLFQGGKEAEAKNRPPAKTGGKLSAVLLTHAHLDHTGRLPLLCKLGYHGPVFATVATVKMTGLIVRDAARIQEQDAAYKNRKRVRAGEDPIEPLYTQKEAETILGCLKTVPYRDLVSVAPGIQARWAEAGHMLGSASIQLVVEEDGRQKTVVFSGDLGPTGVPMLRDFEPFHSADMVFLESTYGDHDHQPLRKTVDEFIRIVKDAAAILLAWMFRNKHVKPFPVFLDSPMAIEATMIYREHRELFDERLKEFIRHKPLIEELKTLKTTASAEESKAINDVDGPCMILAGAGMCNAGRILHHLKQNLWKPETHVLFVGYQGRGSLGRRLIDGADMVYIHGQKVVVNARMHTLSGFSAHAGQTDLLKWFATIAPSKPRVVLTHGEAGPRNALARLIRSRHHLNPVMPNQGDVIEL